MSVEAITSVSLPAENPNAVGAAQAWRLLNKASLEAMRGHEARCRTYAAQAGALGTQTGSAMVDMCVDHVLGLLELTLGNFAVAAWQLGRCARVAERSQLADPLVVRFEPDLVESLLAVGQREVACWPFLTLQLRAERFGSAWARAAAARCRAMLADNATFAGEFETALAHRNHLSPFDCARTQLLFGERLRRARRRADAREHLSAARATFDQLGATPWSERAARELDATSMTTRARNDPSVVDDLTPQERSVVEIMLEGATVREAAGRLFLSPKTVEAHLGRVYRKLGVRNRAQLAMKARAVQRLPA